MKPGDQEQREIRAARNQSLFRAVNERLRELNEAFVAATGTFVISCECADPRCVEQVDVAQDEYEAVRAEPRHFVVLPDHVYPDLERVVRRGDSYVIVEKLAAAGEMAEVLEQQAPRWTDARAERASVTGD